MKKYNVRYTPSADQDVSEAVDYLLEDNVSAAAAFLDELDRVAGQLESFPESGSVSRYTYFAALGYRIAVVSPYLVFYTVKEDTVWIMRVIHEKRNYNHFL